ncbi:hypothetical protein TNCV_2489421 [Trichonephila clavipes]|nr:hypothetical protein TNCV_2489421 [Trichonephila clavipes]
MPRTSKDSNLYERVGRKRQALQREQTSGPHNSGNKSSARMNRCSPYSKPDAFMCGERPKEALLLNASCLLLSNVWGAISWRGLGPLVTLHGKVKVAHYVNIWGTIHNFPEMPTLSRRQLSTLLKQEWFASKIILTVT